MIKWVTPGFLGTKYLDNVKYVDIAKIREGGGKLGSGKIIIIKNHRKILGNYFRHRPEIISGTGLKFS